MQCNLLSHSMEWGTVTGLAVCGMNWNGENKLSTHNLTFFEIVSQYQLYLLC